LLKELARLREPFEVVAIVPGVDAQLPTALGVDARLTGRIAIIARKRSDLKLSNVQVQGFLRNLTFNTVGGPIVNARGWASVDVEKDGRKFRFATTHLDADDAGIRSLQAIDMIAGAGNTNLPLVFVGDFNVTATTGTDTTYGQFPAAGFVDAWTRKRPWDPGLTCCQAANLLNSTSLFDRRIDLVFFRGAFQVVDISLVGERPSDRIPPGLWPSDHAGVVATLRIPRGHH
jgi:endonuclease/exonuclease/phosphatase family metal-dependent hydrolase